MKKFCPNCGKHYGEKAFVCSHCAVELKTLTSENNQTEKSRGKTVAIIVAAVIAVAAIVVAVLFVTGVFDKKDAESKTVASDSVESGDVSGETDLYAETLRLLEMCFRAQYNRDFDMYIASLSELEYQALLDFCGGDCNVAEKRSNERFDLYIDGAIEDLEDCNMSYDKNDLYSSYIKSITVNDVHPDGELFEMAKSMGVEELFVVDFTIETTTGKTERVNEEFLVVKVNGKRGVYMGGRYGTAPSNP